jgi:hypothetical protein
MGKGAMTISSLEQKTLVRWMSFYTHGLVPSALVLFVAPSNGLDAPANG